jgi:hypothetical protein
MHGERSAAARLAATCAPLDAFRIRLLGAARQDGQIAGRASVVARAHPTAVLALVACTTGLAAAAAEPGDKTHARDRAPRTLSIFSTNGAQPRSAGCVGAATRWFKGDCAALASPPPVGGESLGGSAARATVDVGTSPREGSPRVARGESWQTIPTTRTKDSVTALAWLPAAEYLAEGSSKGMVRLFQRVREGTLTPRQRAKDAEAAAAAAADAVPASGAQALLAVAAERGASSGGAASAAPRTPQTPRTPPSREVPLVWASMLVIKPHTATMDGNNRFPQVTGLAAVNGGTHVGAFRLRHRDRATARRAAASRRGAPTHTLRSASLLTPAPPLPSKP